MSLADVHLAEAAVEAVTITFIIDGILEEEADRGCSCDGCRYYVHDRGYTPAIVAPTHVGFMLADAGERRQAREAAREKTRTKKFRRVFAR